MIKRQLAEKLTVLAKQFPVIALLGPRQSGKTTLSKEIFKDYNYVSLEELDQRDFAKTDPKGFLKTHSNSHGLIIDEVQHVPELLSYIQTIVDETQKPGSFILTGSQNLLINQDVSQTLAGRVAILTLLPLSIQELKQSNILPDSLDEAIFNGFYPRIHAQQISPDDWYASYVQTYVERDVRQIQNVSDLSVFRRFMKLCAGRVGQILHVKSLADDCGVSPSTVNVWLSLLEASFIVFLLRPHFRNFNKRLIKMPKLYFYDVGLASHLLDIKSPKDVTSHFAKGGLFESMVLSDLLKGQLNKGHLPNIYFWRDKTHLEIDCIIEDGQNLTPLEIKAGQTLSHEYFSALAKWAKLAGHAPSKGILVYGGDQSQTRKEGQVVSWRNLGEGVA